MPFALLLALAGCTGPSKRTNDPLLGGLLARDPKPAVTAQPASQPLTPLPAPYAGTSPASLAGGGSELRIGGSTTATPTGNDGWSGRPGSTGALPRLPDPPEEIGTARNFFGARSANYEQLKSQLTAHGVRHYRLETWGDTGEVKFSCSIPNRQNAYISRNYEARARDDLTAMRAVLDKIEHDHRN